MKRPFIALFLVVIVAAAVGGSDYALERALNRYLPPLLTEELGLPVTIAPIRADILTLTAYTDRLQMGRDQDPAVVAEQVSVSLDWSDLLTGEIRLVTATGEDLMVKVSSWPSDDDPLPDDYYFLDQWLPRSIDLAAGRYVAEDGAEWPITDGRWRRTDGAATLAWREDRPGGSFEAKLSLASLGELLGLRRFRAGIEMKVAGDQLPNSNLELDIEPAGDAAYTLAIKGVIAGMQGELRGEGSEAWSWPTSSSTRMATLYPERVVELVKLFADDGTEGDLEHQLQSAVPALDLPWHQGNIRLDEMRMGDELVDDVRVTFLADGPRLAVTNIRMRGPSGDLRGSAAAVSTSSGWDAALGADIKTRDADSGLLNRYLDAEWNLQTGRLRLKSDGATWGELIDEMTGLLELYGSYRGETETPVSVKTRLDGKPSLFAMEDLEIKLGESVISGEIRFAGGRERTLHIDASATDLDLKFLFDDPDSSSKQGIAVPAFLVLFPGIDTFWDVRIEALSLPSLQLAKASVDIERTGRKGFMVVEAEGPDAGSVRIDLSYDGPPTGPVPVNLTIEMAQVNIDRMFGQGEGGLPDRVSGRFEFQTEGNDVLEVFQRLQGQADLTIEYRPDRNWTRASRPEEVLKARGNSRLLLAGDRIVGLEGTELDIASSEQDIRGSLSLAVNREFYLIAELDSKQLNVKRLMDWVPEAAEEYDILQALREMRSSRLDLDVDVLDWLEHPIEDLHIRLESTSQRFDMSRADFRHLGATTTNSARLVWQDDGAEFSASGEVQSLGVEEFLGTNLLQQEEYLQKSLEGHYSLAGRGRSVAEIVAGLSGSVKLAGKPAVEGKPPPRIDVDLKRVHSGVEASVNALALAGSDLRGKVVYSIDPRERIDITLSGGILDLEPWEKQSLALESADSGSQEDGAVSEAGRFISDFLSSPARLMGAGGETTEAGARIFSAEPMDLAALSARDIRVDGHLDEMRSTVFLARDIQPSITVEYGSLQADLVVGSINGGTGRGSVKFDTNVSPASLQGEILVLDFYGNREMKTYPRSAHLIFDTVGNSQAELAAHLNGMIYFEGGPGTIDYGGLALLTTDVASSMFRNLIPGARDRQPTLQCAVTLGQFTDGQGITPYGYAARTRTANLLGGIEVNLKKEQLNLKFQSRSREGVGLSVGNAFSNTVDIAGPLSDPRVVPNAPSILFRGWAAFMTAGLSVIGESMINRALASSNPCETIREELRKDLCKSDNALAKSPLACPDDDSTVWPRARSESQPETAATPEEG